MQKQLSAHNSPHTLLTPAKKTKIVNSFISWSEQLQQVALGLQGSLQRIPRYTEVYREVPQFTEAYREVYRGLRGYEAYREVYRGFRGLQGLQGLGVGLLMTQKSGKRFTEGYEAYRGLQGGFQRFTEGYEAYRGITDDTKEREKVYRGLRGIQRLTGRFTEDYEVYTVGLQRIPRVTREDYRGLQSRDQESVAILTSNPAVMHTVTFWNIVEYLAVHRRKYQC